MIGPSALIGAGGQPVTDDHHLTVIDKPELCDTGIGAAQQRYGFCSPVAKAQQVSPLNAVTETFFMGQPVILRSMAPFNGGACEDIREDVPVPLPGLQTSYALPPSFCSEGSGSTPVAKEPIMADTTTPKTGATPGNPPIVLHTQGPWTADDGCIYASGTPVALAYSTTVSAQESDANARLIASAPALLGAMVALMFAALDDDPAVTAQALRQADAVLALFEGSAA